MKKSLLLSFLLFFISCGKDNKSGVPNNQTQNPVIVETPIEENFRRTYSARGIELLREYSEEIRRVIGPEVNNRMRRNLHEGRLVLSQGPVFDQHGHITDSRVDADGTLVLYVGNQEPNLNWHRLLSQKSDQVDQLMIHNLLEQSQVDDSNFRVSRRIVRLNR